MYRPCCVYSRYKIKCCIYIVNCVLNENIYFSLKLECEKLAQEKTEIQRQYIMVSFPFIM